MGSRTSKDTAPPPKAGMPDYTQFKARVDFVTIGGLQRTHDDYIRRATRHLANATNFQEVLFETANVLRDLKRLGIYKDIKIAIDISRGEKATPNGYVVHFKGKELNRITGSIGTELGQNDGAATVELSAPNLFGRGERLGLNYSYSYVRSSVLNLKFTKPYLHTILGDYEPETSFSLYKNASACQWSKFRTDENGALFDFSFLLPGGIRNNLQYELGMKQIYALDKSTPFFVRENCGPRLCSVFRYIGVFDGRDDNVFPTNGVFIKTTNEVMGSSMKQLGVIKNHVHCELNVPLFLGMSMQFCGRVGVILHDKRKETVPINHLFFPGGPQSLRGFEQAGATPYRDGVATGCQSYWAAGMHLWSPLPFNSYFRGFGSLFRTHLFYNFGTCNTFTTDKLRSTAGIGLSVRIGQAARIEFNYCKPLSYEQSDRIKKGFQFGIGYEFL